MNKIIGSLRKNYMLEMCILLIILGVTFFIPLFSKTVKFRTIDEIVFEKINPDVNEEEYIVVSGRYPQKSWEKNKIYQINENGILLKKYIEKKL
ncbi:hypothetical protein AwErysi_07210 [Erysipelotrichaceae bacterium]|nr:hypothetical protein AwErysi_07210 [Erysipelotrichaceae bacterium]